MNLDRMGFLPNTMSLSGSKLCHQTPSVSLYSRSNLYLNVKKIKKINFFLKKVYPSNYASKPFNRNLQCHTQCTLLIPIPDVMQEARQHQDKPLHFIFSDPLPSSISLLSLQLPPIKDQSWQNSHYTSAIQLNWFFYCFALLLNCLIKVQMPLLILDRQE